MASNDGERRMVFDIRGRRKNVVKVVYAILALLMGASLFVAVGPFNISSLFEDAGSSSNLANELEDRAVAVERKLKKDPDDPQLLLNLTRARISAGNARVATNPETGEVAYTVETRQQLELASDAWSKYLKSTDEPSPSGAQLAAQALFGLAQTASTGAELETNVLAAKGAQEIVADARPSLGSLSTLAIYRYFAFDFKGAEEARKEGAKYANTKFERENLGNELDEMRELAVEFRKQRTSEEKQAKKAAAEGGSAFGNPLSESNPLVK